MTKEDLKRMIFYLDGLKIFFDLCIISEQLVKIKICVAEWLDQLPGFKRVKGRTLVVSFQTVRPPAAPA
jgi:hypothetical protein